MLRQRLAVGWFTSQSRAVDRTLNLQQLTAVAFSSTAKHLGLSRTLGQLLANY